MIKDGLSEKDQAVLEGGGEVMIPLQEAPAGGEMVAAKDHPIYAPYFKMMKLGLAPEAVKHKMAKDGLSEKAQAVLDGGGDAMIPVKVGRSTC
jgi:hypothetical protein